MKKDTKAQTEQAGQTAQTSGQQQPARGRNVRKVKKLLSLAFGISPAYIILIVLNSLIGAAQIVTNVVLPKYLIDELIGSQRVTQLILLGGLIAGSNLAFSLIGKLMQRSLNIQNDYMTNKIQQALGIKLMNVDYFYLEDPYYLDLKERAAYVCINQNAVFRLITSVSEILKTSVTLLGLISILITLGPVLLTLNAVAIILAALLLFSFSRYQLGFFQNIVPINRKYGYYLDLGYDQLELQKDIRLYNMAPMLKNRLLQYVEQFMGQFHAYYHKQGVLMGLINVITSLHAALVYGYVALRVLGTGFGRPVGLGSFTMYVNASIQLTTGFRTLVREIVTTRQMLDYLDPFLELMELPEIKQEGEIPFGGEIEEIRFEHLSFTYPNSDKEVLSDLSFEIHKGERISIVGLNGAGKTTLIKLLCRLYKPTAGRILINGRDIYDYEYESYTRNLAAVFQDFKLFDFTLRENITSGESENSPSSSERLKRIVEEVGLQDKIKELPNGLESLYGKEYDEEGIQMSGGQDQKVAIARALYKDASLVILDEPTSALDPLAEADIYQNFNRMVENRTALYISHRMSSSVFCDRILVLDGGRIADFDSHENLMKKGESLYCKLFQAQAENYQETT